MRVRPYRFSIQIYLDVGSQIFLMIALFLCLGLPNLSEGSFLTGLSTLIVIALGASVALGLLGALFGSPYIRHMWDAFKCCGTCWKRQTKPISESSSEEEPKKEVPIVDEKAEIKTQPQFENLEDTQQYDAAKETELQEQSAKPTEEEIESEKASSTDNSKSEEEDPKGVVVEESPSDISEESDEEEDAVLSRVGSKKLQEIEQEEKERAELDAKSEMKTEEPVEEIAEEKTEEIDEEPVVVAEPETTEDSKPSESVAVEVPEPIEEEEDEVPMKEEKQEEEDEINQDLSEDYFDDKDEETVDRDVPPV